MEKTERNPPLLVGGVGIGRSAGKTFGFIALSVLMFLFGLLLVYAKISDEVVGPVPGADWRVTWFGLAFGVGMIVLAPYAIFGLVRSLRAKQRLIVGVDRLQMVEIVDGNDTVVLQIPFANIAGVNYDVTKSHRRVGIDLHDPADPDTFANRGNFETSKRAHGRHFCLPLGYRAGPRAIADAINQAYANWRERC